MRIPHARKLVSTILLTTALSASLIAPASAREQIRVVGSSTVFPFTSAAAEHFGKGGKFKTPIVESTGTGGGFKIFCSGVGETTPDINDASRPITDTEKKLCEANGITNITEIAIGYDGIVIATAKSAAPLELTKKQLFLALAHQLPGADGKLVPNPNKTWKDVDPSFPNNKIEVYGPPSTSGTRDAFSELVMEEACKEFPAFTQAYSDEKARKKVCATLREDGSYIDAGEDDNIIVQKLNSNKKALGIFGYSFLEENRAKVQASKVGGIAPNTATIESGEYKISRSLYVYVKGDHLGKIPGLAEFIAELVSKDALGSEGYLTAKGLLPLNAKDLEKARKQAASLKDSK